MKAGPPLHLHRAQEEYFYVLEGRSLFQVGEQKVELKPRESVLGPRGVPHTFVPVGETPAWMLIGFTPAGQMEEFFRDQEKSGAPFKESGGFCAVWDAVGGAGAEGVVRSHGQRINGRESRQIGGLQQSIIGTDKADVRRMQRISNCKAGSEVKCVHGPQGMSIEDELSEVDDGWAQRLLEDTE